MTMGRFGCSCGPFLDFAMGRFGCMMGRFGQCNGPFWTIVLEIKIFGAVLVGAVLAMGRFGIDPSRNLCHFLSSVDLRSGFWQIPIHLMHCASGFQYQSTIGQSGLSSSPVE